MILGYIYTCILTYFIWISGGYSQELIIHGKVSTTNGPVSYAAITFIDQIDTSKTIKTMTDESGNYQLGLPTSIKNRAMRTNVFELYQNFPNPFSIQTTISYWLKNQTNISITIYNILGEVVKKNEAEMQQAGIHEFIWNGRNESGNRVVPSAYFYKVKAGSRAAVGKMVLLNGNVSTQATRIRKTSSHVLKLSEVEINQLTYSSYTVQITNGDSTTPKIISSEFADIIIQADTTIDFQVDVQPQWKLLGLENERVVSIAVEPENPEIIYAGTLSDFSTGFEGKLFKSLDEGTTWDTLLVGGYYRNIIIDPNDYQRVFATSSLYGIIRSLNEGETWDSLNDGLYLTDEITVQSLAMNYQNTQILYVGTGGIFPGDLYKSFDGGLHWDKVSSWASRDGVSCITIDPADTNTIYVGSSTDGTVWKSTDAGLTWSETSLKESGNLHDIFICPDQPSTVFVGAWGLFKTEDGGETWMSERRGLPESLFNVIKVQKSMNSRLFLVATNNNGGGIYEYSYLQSRWNRIGIDNESYSYYYTDLKVYTNPDRLYFGGRGIYTIELSN